MAGGGNSLNRQEAVGYLNQATSKTAEASAKVSEAIGKLESLAYEVGGNAGSQLMNEYKNLGNQLKQVGQDLCSDMPQYDDLVLKAINSQGEAFGPLVTRQQGSYRTPQDASIQPTEVVGIKSYGEAAQKLSDLAHSMQSVEIDLEYARQYYGNLYSMDGTFGELQDAVHSAANRIRTALDAWNSAVNSFKTEFLSFIDGSQSSSTESSAAVDTAKLSIEYSMSQMSINVTSAF